MISLVPRKVLSWLSGEARVSTSAIPCLPADTAYDVRCPICNRGFLILRDPADHADRGALRRVAVEALAAQHTPRKTRTDRRKGLADRRQGLPDLRAEQVERRIGRADRRVNDPDRRSLAGGRRENDTPPAMAARPAGGSVHPRKLFYLHRPGSQTPAS